MRSISTRNRVILGLLPYAMMGAVALSDALTGPEYGFLPLLSLGPAFASLSGGVKRALSIGGLAMVLCAVLALDNDLPGTRQNIVTWVTLLGVIGASVVATIGRQRRERELANVRSIAEAAQRVLLKPVPRRAGHLRIAVSYTSAVTEALIGGDLYEVTVSPGGGVRMIVGDVQGKGLEAVETAALVLGAFREAAPYEPDIRSVGVRLERAMNHRLTGEDFVTAILAEIRDDDLTLLNYGHPAPLLLRADGTSFFAEPKQAAPPLGLADLEPDPPEPYGLPFTSGDQLLLYTDGVIEARDPSGEFYPLEDRASHLKADDPEQALHDLRQDLLDHLDGPIQDDTAMLLVRCKTHLGVLDAQDGPAETR